MTGISETRDDVKYWFKIGGSRYFMGELRSAIVARLGEEAANLTLQDIDTLANNFGRFKSGHIHGLETPSLARVSLREMIYQTFLCSNKAYEEHHRQRPTHALILLKASMDLDAAICNEWQIQPIIAHYYQSRHNVCRLFAALGRNRALQKFLSETLKLLADAIPQHDKSIAILLELMGLQILAYYIGACERGLIESKNAPMLSDRPDNSSHLLMNMRIFDYINQRDTLSTARILRNREVVLLSVFKKYVK